MSAKSKRNGMYIYFGTEYWYINGLISREDGPAITYPSGEQRWILNEKLHREDGGPAIRYPNGELCWYTHGELDREDGPAITGNGKDRWYLKDKQYTEEEFWNLMSMIYKPAKR